MRKILERIKQLKSSEVSALVEHRMSEFESVKRRGNLALYEELCYCLLTANFQAEKSLQIQNVLSGKFHKLTQAQLAKELRRLGYRFPNVRASFIVEAREHIDKLPGLLQQDESSAREYLSQNVRGLGMKESSHFLRNVGAKNLAIIDFHIVDILEEHGLVERPKTMTPSKYLEIESTLRKLSKKSGVSMSELDLYLWYAETGKILK